MSPFEDVDIGGGGVVAVEDAGTDGVVEGAQVLPNVVKDAIRVEAEEQLLAEDRGEREGDVDKEHKRGLAEAWLMRPG